MAESEVPCLKDALKVLFDAYLQERTKNYPSSFYIRSSDGNPVTINAHQRGGKELAKARRQFRRHHLFIEERGTRSRWFRKENESKELILSNEIFDTCFDLISAFRAEHKSNSREAWNKIASCTYGLHQQDFLVIWNLVREHPDYLDGTMANFTGSPQSQVADLSVRFDEAQDEMGVLEESTNVADNATADEDWEKVQSLRSHYQTYIDLEAKRSRGNSKSAFYEGAQYAVKVLQILQKSKRLEVVADCENSMQVARSGSGHPFFVVEEHERHRSMSSDSSMKEIWKKLNPKDSTATMDYSRKDKNRWGGQDTLNSKIIERFRARQTRHATLRDLPEHNNISNFLPPLNCLNMAYTGPPRMPACLEPRRYSILSELNNRLHMGDAENTTNRPTKRKEPIRHTDFVDGLRFTLLTQSDAVTFIHCDRHALGTYGISIAGEKLWIMITFNSPQAQARYQDQCENFDFEDCELHWTFLNPGKIVVMLRSVPHIVITTEDSLFYGGSFWDGEDLIETLEELKTEFVHGLQTTNESAAKQLPEVLRKLGEMCEDQCWMKEFKIRDEEAFWKVWRDTLDVVEGRSKKKTTSRYKQT